MKQTPVGASIARPSNPIKKILSLFLSITMLLSITAGLDLSAYAETFEDYEYIASNSEATITKYIGSAADLTIPSDIDGNTVTGIGNGAFSGCTGLTSVTIPDSVTSLGNEAFSGCTALTTATIGNSVESIGNEAFSGCAGLTSITIPNSVTSLGDMAFQNCVNLVSATIQGNLEEIALRCFNNCTSLANVVLPDSVNTINSSAFSNTAITEITIPDKTTSIGTSAFQSCEKLTTVKGGSGITDIGSSAFSYTALENFEMPNNLNSIGSHAFESTDIKTVIMPETLTELGQEAFSFCGKLEKVVIPQNITAIPKKSFYRCINLKDVVFSDHLTEIELQAFDSCSNLTSVNLPNTLTRIENEAFFNSGLTDVTIPGSVEIIGNDAFWGNDLTHASIDAKNIRTRAFANNRELTSVEFGTNVETIGAYAFDGNLKLDNVDVPENVTTIGAYAFLDNSSMKKITVRNDNCHLGKNCIDISATIVCNKTSSAANYAELNGNDRSCMDEHILSSKLVKATTENDGYTITACEECDHVENKTIIPSVASVKLSATKYTYDGKVKKPTVTVKDSEDNTISASNYTVTYQNGRKNVGNYTVTIKFTGNYSGTVEKTFTIKPQATSVGELTAKSKGFIANWKKQATQTTGYQIQYSTSSNFKSAKTVTVTKNSTTSKKISNLKAKKKYCVRIRTYKTVNGEKIYSSWSKYKSVTTK